MTEPVARRGFLKKTVCFGLGTAMLFEQLGAAEEPVRVRTLGTGAADHDWKRLGAPGVRGSTSTLLDGHVLIDCGTTGSANLARFGVAPSVLTDLLITHSHGDHFNCDEIRNVLEQRSTNQPPLDVWAAPEPLATLKQALPDRFVGHELRAGTAFPCGRLRFTALPANHQLPNPAEQALHFLAETPCGNLLYALDGAWMLKQAKQLIGKKRLDMIIWDATMSETGDYRIFEHNDLAMIGLMMQSLATTGNVHPDTVCVLDHTARTLWPSDPQEADKLATDRGWILAADGMELKLG